MSLKTLSLQEFREHLFFLNKNNRVRLEAQHILPQSKRNGAVTQPRKHSQITKNIAANRDSVPPASRSDALRVVRVQEAAGLNPATPTKNPVTAFAVTGFLINDGIRKTGRSKARL